MNLALSAEQLDLASSVRNVLTKEFEVADLVDPVRTRTKTASLWKLAADLGWLSIGLSVDLGGLGFGLTEQVVLCQELGRALAPGPFVATVLAARLAAASGERELALRLGGGSASAAFLVDEYAVDAVDQSVLVEFGSAGAHLRTISALEEVEAVDPGCLLARVYAGDPLASVEDPEARARAQVLVGAQLLGICEAVTEMSAEYATARVQFGSPIGRNQAVKHRCADMAIQSYATRASVFFAAARLDEGHPDATVEAAAAFMVASSSAQRIASANIQNHGAVGITAAHPAHLFVKRALVLSRILGPMQLSQAQVLASERYEFR